MATSRDLTQLIDYRCVQPDHLQSNVQDCVFVHADGWAYCTAGRRAEGHTFIRTGGLERRRLERGTLLRRDA